jgi:SAM-dependent methyltransferase
VNDRAARPEHLARLRSAITRLALEGVPPRGLEVGCGDSPAAALAAVLPAWQWIALDVDHSALRRAPRGSAALVRADAERPPLAVGMRFGLILVRHPDVLRRHAWARLLPGLAHWLAPRGALLITLFSHDEARVVHDLPLPPARLLDDAVLAPATHDGRDRIVLAFQLAVVSADA